jgi:hypothetical protein
MLDGENRKDEHLIKFVNGEVENRLASIAGGVGVVRV